MTLLNYFIMFYLFISSVVFANRILVTDDAQLFWVEDKIIINELLNSYSDRLLIDLYLITSVDTQEIDPQIIANKFVKNNPDRILSRARIILFIDPKKGISRVLNSGEFHDHYQAEFNIINDKIKSRVAERAYYEAALNFTYYIDLILPNAVNVRAKPEFQKTKIDRLKYNASNKAILLLCLLPTFVIFSFLLSKKNVLKPNSVFKLQGEFVFINSDELSKSSKGF